MSYCVLTAGGAYRTKLMDRATADSVRRLLEANPRFTDVRLHTSEAAKSRKTGEPSERRFYLAYKPTNPAGLDQRVSAAADACMRRAEAQYADYRVFLDLDHPDTWRVVKVATGEAYMVTPDSCECPHFNDRLKPAGIRECKHHGIARIASGRGEFGLMGGNLMEPIHPDDVEEEPPLEPPAPAPAIAAAAPRTREEIRAQALKDRELWGP